jgi:hypothetical protein
MQQRFYRWRQAILCRFAPERGIAAHDQQIMRTSRGEQSGGRGCGQFLNGEGKIPCGFA